MQDHLVPFSEDFNYIYGPPFTEADGQDLINIKLEALDHIRETTGWADRRCAAVVQLISLIRIELPRLFYKEVPWDIDSAYLFTQQLVDNATIHLLGFPISILFKSKNLGFGITHNTVYHILSTPALSILCDVLGNPVEDIINMTHDGATDQPTAVSIIEAAYNEVFSGVLEDFSYPLYANTDIKDLVGFAVREYVADLEAQD